MLKRGFLLATIVVFSLFNCLVIAIPAELAPNSEQEESEHRTSEHLLTQFDFVTQTTRNARLECVYSKRLAKGQQANLSLKEDGRGGRKDNYKLHSMGLTLISLNKYRAGTKLIASIKIKGKRENDRNIAQCWLASNARAAALLNPPTEDLKSYALPLANSMAAPSTSSARIRNMLGLSNQAENTNASMSISVYRAGRAVPMPNAMGNIDLASESQQHDLSRFASPDSIALVTANTGSIALSLTRAVQTSNRADKEMKFEVPVKIGNAAAGGGKPEPVISCTINADCYDSRSSYCTDKNTLVKPTCEKGICVNKKTECNLKPRECRFSSVISFSCVQESASASCVGSEIEDCFKRPNACNKEATAVHGWDCVDESTSDKKNATCELKKDPVDTCKTEEHCGSVYSGTTPGAIITEYCEAGSCKENVEDYCATKYSCELEGNFFTEKGPCTTTATGSVECSTVSSTNCLAGNGADANGKYCSDAFTLHQKSCSITGCKDAVVEPPKPSAFCDENYHLRNVKCGQDSNGFNEYYNSDQGFSDFCCPEGLVGDKTKEECVCPNEGQVYNKEKKACECPIAGQTYNASIKQCQCPTGLIANPESKTCECPAGQVYSNSEQRCYTQCPVGEGDSLFAEAEVCPGIPDPRDPYAIVIRGKLCCPFKNGYCDTTADGLAICTYDPSGGGNTA